MRHTVIATLAPHVTLHRCPRTGLAWVEDGTTGIGHSAHPNISASGSVRGMRQRGYWGRTDRVVRSHGFAYNVDRLVYSETDPWDVAARDACRCVACSERNRA